MRGTLADCNLAADLLALWSQLTNDQGTYTSSWVWTGSPAGILHQPDIGPVFPLATEPDPDDHSNIDTKYDTIRNYKGVEDTDEAYQQLKSFSEKKAPWLEHCKTLGQAIKYLGGLKLVLSKIGVIIRI